MHKSLAPSPSRPHLWISPPTRRPGLQRSLLDRGNHAAKSHASNLRLTSPRRPRANPEHEFMLHVSSGTDPKKTNAYLFSYITRGHSRTRKIRCDGAKPICHNCGKRASGSSECNYDPLPKRRGPDKTPGARQRVARKMSEGGCRSRRRATSSGTQDYSPDNSGTQLPPFSFPSPSSSDNTQSPEEYIMSPHEVRMNAPGVYISTCACHGLTHCPSAPGPILDHAIPGSQVGNIPSPAFAL